MDLETVINTTVIVLFALGTLRWDYLNWKKNKAKQNGGK